jgi:mannose-6-phosphate isomerase-like protein (cupin superfamily)
MVSQHAYEVLTESTASPKRIGPISRFFTFCRELTTGLNADIRAGRLTRPCCVKTVLDSASPLDEELLGALRSVKDEYPIRLIAPFEGVSSISGAVWKASELFGNNDVDAVLKLRFQAGSTDLPIHSHEYSDRVLVVIDGEGVFDVLPSAASSPDQIRATPVSTGDVLAFSRGVLHTFRTYSDDLLLLSYHSPFIPLNDPRQYKVLTY